MARIAGIDLPRNKKIEYALTYIHGIGKSASNDILDKVGIDKNIRVNELNDQQIILNPYIYIMPKLTIGLALTYLFVLLGAVTAVYVFFIYPT